MNRRPRVDGPEVGQAEVGDRDSARLPEPEVATGEWAGALFGADGIRLPYRRLFLRSLNGEEHSIATDRDGHFRATLPVGRWQVFYGGRHWSVVGGGNTDALLVVEIIDSVTSFQDVVLAGERRLCGVLRGPRFGESEYGPVRVPLRITLRPSWSQEPVAEALVAEIQRKEQPAIKEQADDTSGALPPGAFEIEGLRPDQYILTVRLEIESDSAGPLFSPLEIPVDLRTEDGDLGIREFAMEDFSH